MALTPQKISAQTTTTTLADSDAFPVVTAAGNRQITALNAATQIRSKAGLATNSNPEFASVNVGHPSDTTVSRLSAGEIAVEGNRLFRAGGADVPLADGGTGASLSDPGGDRILFWDDSAGTMAWLNVSGGISISDTTMSGSGGGGGTASVPKIITSASTTYQATGLNGSRHIELTITGDTAITASTFTGLTAGTVYYVVYEIIASGATRTPTFSGFTLAGGVNPARPIASGQRLFVNAEAHTDNTGAVILSRLIGVYDPTSEPSATLAPTDTVLIADADDSNKPKSVQASSFRDLTGRALELVAYIPITGDGTYEIIPDNTIFGTVSGITTKCSPGSLTANFRIADHTGSSDLTPTSAASITGLSAVSVTTSYSRATASAANTMQKSGTTDRVLQVVITGSTGSPTELAVVVRGTT